MNYNRLMNTTAAKEANPRREVDRAGKEAYASYLSLLRVRDALERTLRVGAPDEDARDAVDALEGRLERVRRGIARARTGYPPAGNLPAEIPTRFDAEELSDILAAVISLLTAMDAEGLGISPTSIRYLPDSERDRTVLGRAMEVLAAVGAPRGALGIFGSVARGENVPGSDIDILIRSDTLPSLEDEAALADAIAEALSPLGLEADVVLEQDLAPEYLPVVLSELVALEGKPHAV